MVSSVGRLHLVTDHRLVARGQLDELLSVISAAVRGGADSVQIRLADDTTDRDAYHFASQILGRCRECHVTCLVNDRLDLALAIGADGAHIGADDLPVPAARRILGPGAILGVTARTAQAARQAVNDGASYLGVGPVFTSPTKPDLPNPLGPTGLRDVAKAVAAPVVAIGGITPGLAPMVWNAGIHGIAVVGAISAAGSPEAAARELLAARS